MCQIAVVRARMRCRILTMTPAGVVAAVAFEVELAFERVVDGLDDLTQRRKEPGASSCCPARKAAAMSPWRRGWALAGPR